MGRFFSGVCALIIPAFTLIVFPTSRFCSTSKGLEMGRVVYIVRHAERIDNVNRNWRAVVGNQFKTDNSPLSERGHTQCQELQAWFKDIEVDHVFASPFDRTLDTATRMIGDRNIPIKPEAGFLEALYLCNDPVGVRSMEALTKAYPLIDKDYEPVFNPWKGKLPKEGYGDDGCTPRVSKTIDNILNKYEGDIVIVSHGAPTGALLEVLLGRWTYVGQATVSKLVQDRSGGFTAEYVSGDKHLSDRKNLRPW